MTDTSKTIRVLIWDERQPETVARSIAWIERTI